MPKIQPFQEHTARYERWFEDNRWVYHAELKAVKSLVPEGQFGLEIGAGTGRFAAPLGITIGIEPSSQMRGVAQQREITIVDAVAENLPFKDSLFDLVLMVTTICFVDDMKKSFEEAHRVLKTGGNLVIGLVDRTSPLGQLYVKHQKDNVFYKDATFFSVDEVLEIMKQTGFGDFQFYQTIFCNLKEVTENEAVKPGYGEGSFVVIRGAKK